MLKDLLQKRAGVWDQLKSLNDLSISEKRDFNADEKIKYENLEKELQTLDGQIERAKRIDASDRSSDDSLMDFRNDRQEHNGGGAPSSDRDKQLRALDNFEKNRRNIIGLPDQDVKAIEDLQNLALRSFCAGGFGRMSQMERRALQQGSDTEGGYLVAPVQWMDKLIQRVDDLVFIRQLATKERITGAQSIGCPSLDTDMDDWEWTTELSTGTDDDALRFGKRELSTNPMAKRVKISKKLLATSSRAEGIVLERMAYKRAKTEEVNFLTGDGQGKPLGLFTASTDGISTSRDVSTDNTSSAVTFNGLIEAVYALKGQYHGRARWIFHRDLVKMLRKIKDSNGQYIWQPSVVQGEPDRVLNFPYLMSEYCPNTFTANQYVGMLGDFSYYWILDSLDMELQRLTELYAESNQMGFIGRQESDGMPVLEEAFVRVKLGA